MISFMKYGTSDRELAAEVDAGLLLHDLDAQVALAAGSACGSASRCGP